MRPHLGTRGSVARIIPPWREGEDEKLQWLKGGRARTKSTRPVQIRHHTGTRHAQKQQSRKSTRRVESTDDMRAVNLPGLLASVAAGVVGLVAVTDVAAGVEAAVAGVVVVRVVCRRVADGARLALGRGLGAVHRAVSVGNLARVERVQPAEGLACGYSTDECGQSRSGAWCEGRQSN